jgi:hypothetical protein
MKVKITSVSRALVKPRMLKTSLISCVGCFELVWFHTILHQRPHTFHSSPCTAYTKLLCSERISGLTKKLAR